MKCILIDNGHGCNTAGKRSPDGRLLEYAWTREVAAMVVAGLKKLGYEAELLTPEVNDVRLSERVRRVNKKCIVYGAENVTLVSVHCNAAPGAGWSKAQGWSVFVSANASANSKRLCDLLYVEACKNGRKVRVPLPTQSYWVQSLAMTRDTKCPAVLVENYFMNNEDDCDWLLSEEGKAECCRIMVDGLDAYNKKQMAQMPTTKPTVTPEAPGEIIDKPGDSVAEIN